MGIEADTKVRLCTRVSLYAMLVLLVSACTPSVKFPQLQPGRIQLDKDPDISLGSVSLTPQIDVIDSDRGLLEHILTFEIDDFIKDSRTDLETVIADAISRNHLARYVHGGAGYIINLTGTFSAKDTASATTIDRRVDSKKSETVSAVKVERSCHLDLSYEVITSQGSVVGTGRHVSTDHSSGTDVDRKEAAARCMVWVKTYNSLTRAAVTAIVDEILPHYVTVKRKLKKGKSRLLNEGVEQATLGDLERAGTAWKSILQQVDALSQQDRIALYNNLGVYFESHDNLDESAKAFISCTMSGGDELCNEGLNRTRDRQSQLELLKKSGL